jgi:coenzyme F420-0:L-glutamate ligase/coenzyme F420-1:gamma-L-glutamate ligase
MIDLMDAVRQRRSIRNYTQQSVPLELIREILQAATWAPSAHNAQPWQFIVLTDEACKFDLADAMAEVWLQELEQDGIPKTMREASVRTSADRFSNAPVLILACLSLEDMDAYPDEKRKGNERELAIQSLGAAIQNLLLATHAKGLGACWYCAPIFCKNAVRKTLKIPEEIDPQALITLGYPTEQPNAPARKPLEYVVSGEEWDKPL